MPAPPKYLLGSPKTSQKASPAPVSAVPSNGFTLLPNSLTFASRFKNSPACHRGWETVYCCISTNLSDLLEKQLKVQVLSLQKLSPNNFKYTRGIKYLKYLKSCVTRISKLWVHFWSNSMAEKQTKDLRRHLDSPLEMTGLGSQISLFTAAGGKACDQPKCPNH